MYSAHENLSTRSNYIIMYDMQYEIERYTNKCCENRYVFIFLHAQRPFIIFHNTLLFASAGCIHSMSVSLAKLIIIKSFLSLRCRQYIMIINLNEYGTIYSTGPYSYYELRTHIFIYHYYTYALCICIYKNK